MNQKIITTEMLNDLPEPVHRYMQYTGIVGQPWIENVWLKQMGRFRQGLDRPWMPMVAEQKYTTRPAGFVWDAKFKMAGLNLPIKGQAVWNLPSGDLPYIELEITEIVYNQTAS